VPDGKIKGPAGLGFQGFIERTANYHEALEKPQTDGLKKQAGMPAWLIPPGVYKD
jgi:hypothetical protein